MIWIILKKRSQAEWVSVKSGDKDNGSFCFAIVTMVSVEETWVTYKARAKLTQGIHPEVVGLQHGFGHWVLGSIVKNAGISDASLRPCKADPLSGQAIHKQCCVKIYKA